MSTRSGDVSGYLFIACNLISSRGCHNQHPVMKHVMIPFRLWMVASGVDCGTRTCLRKMDSTEWMLYRPRILTETETIEARIWHMLTMAAENGRIRQWQMEKAMLWQGKGRVCELVQTWINSQNTSTHIKYTLIHKEHHWCSPSVIWWGTWLWAPAGATDHSDGDIPIAAFLLMTFTS